MEVIAQIQFVRPCLGNVRKPDFDRLLRDPDGEVIFLATWWRSAFLKAARAINRYYKLVDKIRPALTVSGPVSHIKRWYGNDSSAFKVHEGFDTGTTVTAQFLLPSGMTLDQFRELLETVGCYFGISPYGWKAGYGIFHVLSVMPLKRARPLKRTSTPDPA
jgi:hypothetical protein